MCIRDSVLSYAKIRASYGANGNVSGVLDANGNVVTGLDYYTVQGSYAVSYTHLLDDIIDAVNRKICCVLNWWKKSE